MSRFRPFLLVALVVAIAFAAVPGLATAQSGEADIVVLNDDSDAKSIASQHSKRFGFSVVHVYRFAMRGYSAVLSPTQREQVRRERAVLFVDDADESETPPAGPSARRPPEPEQVVPFGVHRLDADLSSARSGDGKGKVDVDVAVIDSGIQPDHPDLRVAGGVNCLPGYKRSDWNDIDSLVGHGTFIAGIVGAQDNKIGVVGYAPGARMWAVRAFDANGFGTSADVICGLDWVAQTRLDKDQSNDIEVANMSYAVNSGTSFSTPVVAGTVGLCIASGPCAGKTATAIIRKILDDAAAYNRRHSDYGYVGDPFRPQPNQYFGWLIRTGLY